MRKSMPSNFQIFDYWKDKTISGEYVLDDWGEPSCWCCNKPIIVKDEERLQLESDYKEIWNRTSRRLERCHIVPKSLGGSYEPSNLFLMCPTCHSNAPNVINGNLFLKWVLIQRRKSFLGINLVDRMKLISEMCKEFGIDELEFIKFMGEHSVENLKSKTSTHGAKFNISTHIIGMISEFLEEKSKVHIELAI